VLHRKSGSKYVSIDYEHPNRVWADLVPLKYTRSSRIYAEAHELGASGAEIYDQAHALYAEAHIRKI
jgi:hypothetical protein